MFHSQQSWLPLRPGGAGDTRPVFGLAHHGAPAVGVRLHVVPIALPLRVPTGAVDQHRRQLVGRVDQIAHHWIGHQSTDVPGNMPRSSSGTPRV